MRRWRRVGVLLLLAACTSDAGSGTTTTTQSTATTTTPAPTATIARPATDQLLEDLDASLCPDSEFTCVTLDMPMNHFDAADERTIPVTFAVLPATGERLGAFVTATGGPGSSGIAVADSYTDALDPAIPESYDIVFFDQRGVAMSGGLSCPQAAGAYYRVDATTALGFDQEELTSAASTFADDCVAEMGDPEMLPYLGTDQVVEDLEVFRDTFGYEQIVLYGESYGTQVSQTYAAAYGDRVARLILDGTVDLTLEAFDFFEEQATAFGDTLQSTLDYCAEDEFCASDLGVAPDEAYDQLLALLAEGPLTAQYPLPSGGFEERTFGLGDLEVVASGQMYSEDDRMMFLRALAAHSGRGDLVPAAQAPLSQPRASTPRPRPCSKTRPTRTPSIYAVECLDYHYPGSTPEEKAQAFFTAGADLNPGRLGILFFGDLPCAFWPNAREDATRPEALVAPGTPTVVLGATADPATPYQQGVDVSGRLEEGYLISQQGGPHVIFGRGNECPDDAVTGFILEGTAPEVTECEGDVVGYYITLLPISVDEFDSAETMLDSVEFEIFYMPEYYWWDTVTDTPAGCNQGGVITFTVQEETDGFILEECVFMEGLTLTGDGSYNWDEDIFTLDVQIGAA